MQVVIFTLGAPMGPVTHNSSGKFTEIDKSFLQVRSNGIWQVEEDVFS